MFRIGKFLHHLPDWNPIYHTLVKVLINGKKGKNREFGVEAADGWDADGASAASKQHSANTPLTLQPSDTDNEKQFVCNIWVIIIVVDVDVVVVIIIININLAHSIRRF